MHKSNKQRDTSQKNIHRVFLLFGFIVSSIRSFHEGSHGKMFLVAMDGTLPPIPSCRPHILIFSRRLLNHSASLLGCDLQPLGFPSKSPRSVAFCMGDRFGNTRKEEKLTGNHMGEKKKKSCFRFFWSPTKNRFSKTKTCWTFEKTRPAKTKQGKPIQPRWRISWEFASLAGEVWIQKRESEVLGSPDVLFIHSKSGAINMHLK